ncbi:putative recombination initiation defects 3 [Gastrolobium bilobum]|uniref:putative recombination initiation defects 3 n=1 Tax=Gastrolobium bilobum TaxID=150636 RepID=UPI002AB010BF|nr:putative recombination initiation defects 3 [Gastrolobium bilobum]
MKINKACDLSSISVLPPHTRRPNTVPSGLQSSQPRSQPSQQSISHGLSSHSQHAMLSQFSQNSQDEAVINSQRVCSQEHENSVRRSSCLPRIQYSREESQQPNLISSSTLMRKWNSADHKSQLSEGLEHRIGIMETSLNRIAMILDSVQSDVMQVNKGTKETNLEMECIRQKLIIHDNSLQLMIKGQEEIKASIEGNLKSLSEHMCKVTSQEKLQEVSSVVSTLPQLIEASLRSLQNELDSSFTKEMQVTTPKRPQPQPAANLSLVKALVMTKVTGIFLDFSEAKITVAPKVEMGGWKPVKNARVTFSDKLSEKVHKQTEPNTGKYEMGGRDYAIIIESDEETAESCSSLVEENAVFINFHGEELYGKFTKEEDEEAQQIFQKARRRKRKYCNATIIH